MKNIYLKLQKEIYYYTKIKSKILNIIDFL